MKISHKVAALALAAAAAWSPSQAQQVSDGGRLLASNCFQCHGTNGVKGGFDSLAGESKSELLKEFREMRVKAAGSDVMIPHLRGYTDVELGLIATYFSKQRKR